MCFGGDWVKGCVVCFDVSWLLDAVALTGVVFHRNGFGSCVVDCGCIYVCGCV